MVIFGAFLGLSLVFLIICSGLLKWNELRYRKKGLPPGTMGWPLFGETMEFLNQGPSFMKNQRARWLFRLRLFSFSIIEGGLTGVLFFLNVVSYMFHFYDFCSTDHSSCMKFIHCGTFIWFLWGVNDFDGIILISVWDSRKIMPLKTESFFLLVESFRLLALF